jgi:hypothetical protein
MSAVAQLHTMPHPAPVLPRAHRLQAWAAIAVLIIVPLLAIAGGQAGVLRITYPPLTVLVSAFLYWRSKPLYVGLVFWLWFFTPFLGRMAEFQAGYTPSDAVLVSPYLAAGISVLVMFKEPGRLGERRAVPHVCALVGVLYGAIIGFPRYPLFDVLRASLNWVVPIIFGFFILQNRDMFPEFRKVIGRSFLYGLLISGAYGIWQFFNLPEWDRVWMLNAQLNSFGKPEDMSVRVFSTMNAPAIFAAVGACGLLLLFNQTGKLRLLSSALAFLAVILTMSRASWVSLVAGFLFLTTQIPMRQIFRLLVAILACGVFLLAFAQIPAVHDLVAQRFDTFADPGQDVSFTARVQGHEQALRSLAQEPFGEGIGSTDAEHNTEGDDAIIGPHDSTLLEFLYSLGWIGSLIYAVGLLVLIVQLRGSGKDPFALSCKAIVFALLAQSLLNSIMLGILGFLVWTFASLTILEKERLQEATAVTAPAAQPVISMAA